MPCDGRKRRGDDFEGGSRRKTAALGSGCISLKFLGIRCGAIRWRHPFGRGANRWVFGVVSIPLLWRVVQNLQIMWGRAGLLHCIGLSTSDFSARVPSLHGVAAASVFWYYMEQILLNSIKHEEQIETDNGEGAPVHTSAASARRRGPPLAIKPSSCCEAARWRENECADPRQLCQLKWRSTRAGGCIYLYPSSLQAILSSKCFFIVNSFFAIFCEFDFGDD